MQENKRQKQVGALLLQELSDIFQRLGLSMIDGGLVSLTAVKVTPDLLEARVYLSLFQVKDIPATLKKIEERAWEIKRELAARVKHQLRRIPTLEWFHDDTLEHADRMDELFRRIKAERPAGSDNREAGGDNPDGKEGPQ
jgi:ribosome-binding factor A